MIKYLLEPGQTLSQRATRSGAWVFGANIADRAFGIVRTIILARLLVPEDFGVVGVALLVIATLNIFSTTGFFPALIQKKGDIKSYLDTAWRLLVGWHLAIPESKHLNNLEMQVKKAIISEIGDADGLRSLPYPSDNLWIVDEIALWLTLGRLLGVNQGLIPRRWVIQGGARGEEFADILAPDGCCVAAHYFSFHERLFQKYLAIRAFSPRGL